MLVEQLGEHKDVIDNLKVITASECNAALKSAKADRDLANVPEQHAQRVW